MKWKELTSDCQLRELSHSWTRRGRSIRSSTSMAVDEAIVGRLTPSSRRLTKPIQARSITTQWWTQRSTESSSMWLSCHRLQMKLRREKTTVVGFSTHRPKQGRKWSMTMMCSLRTLTMLLTSEKSSWSETWTEMRNETEIWSRLHHDEASAKCLIVTGFSSDLQ